MLDVGCGWGSFAIHAAARHGVARARGDAVGAPGELARERAREAGVADKVEIRVADYREMTDGPFDAIASIGMVEHVGEERIDLYAARLGVAAAARGEAAQPRDRQAEGLRRSRRGPVLGAVRVPRRRAAAALAGRARARARRAGDDHVEGLPDDYAETLSHWIERFDSRYDEAVRLAGIERARVWRLYLRAARLGFVTGWASVYQVLAHQARG